MPHKFSFHNGTVSYANKYVRSRNYKKAMEKGKISYSVFATDPCRNIFQCVLVIFFPQVSDNTVVNTIEIANHFVALPETPMSVKFDLKVLETVGVFDYENQRPGTIITAHSHYDFAKNAVVNYTLKFSRASTYNVYRMPTVQNQNLLVGSVPVKDPTYMHSFGMTENYVILVEFPLVVNPLHLLFSGKSFIKNYRWKPEKSSRFLIMD